MKKGFLRGERGVEPLAMKIMAGVILLVIGLGIGYGIYTLMGERAKGLLSFSVSVSPGSTTIGIPAPGEPDNVKNLSVTVELIGTYDKTVTLTATGVPTGVSVSFSPASGTPKFGSTMTISVGSTAVAGTTTITIRGKGTDGTEKSATLELILE